VTTGQSSLLDLAAGYFWLSAALAFFAAAVGTIEIFRNGDESDFMLVLAVPFFLALTAGYVWVGKLLAHGKRKGGFIALGLTLVSVGSASTVLDLVTCALSFIAIALIWRNLD
jgi:hypothetical protein